MQFKMNQAWKERFNCWTYGLIYPAFFGNMIYDLMVAEDKFNKAKHPAYAFWIALAITCYYFVDFIHLNVDMHSIAPKVENRSSAYILCDTGTAVLFFCAYVGVVQKHYWLTSLSVSIIPLVICIYKFRNKMNKINVLYLIPFAFLSLLFGIIITIQLCKNHGEVLDEGRGIFIYTLACLIAYVTYVFCVYPGKPKKADKEYMTTNTIY